MKALTICQPHAHFIAHGPKRVENRTWRTDYRGPLLIHAGKSRKYLRGCGTAHIFRCYGLAPPSADTAMPFGAIIAVCDLIDCVRLQDVHHDHPGVCPTDFIEGPWCWIIDHVRRLPEPIPFTGRQMLFDVPDEVVGGQPPVLPQTAYH